MEKNYNCRHGRFLSSPDRLASYRNPETASPIVISRHDEIGALEESYNQLLETIKNLIGEVKYKEEEKKQYELNMLQIQIQPHFLYNTLACIGSLAKLNKIDEVRNTLSSLVNLLSFTFDKPAEIVSLSEELEAIRMYVQIQKMRFGNIFEVDFQVTGEAMKRSIPKLTLQPVIENAIVNSILPRNHKNGLGLGKEKIENLKNSIYNRQFNTPPPSRHSRRYRAPPR